MRLYQMASSVFQFGVESWHPLAYGNLYRILYAHGAEDVMSGPDHIYEIVSTEQLVWVAILGRVASGRLDREAI
jgi:hypothetical protein